MSIIKGTASAVLAGTRRRFDPSRGWTTVFRYEFSDSASANAFGGAQAGGQNAVDIDDRGPVYSVEISSPTVDPGGTEDPVGRFEVFPVETEKAIWELPAFQSLTAEEQGALRVYAEDQSDANHDAALAAISSFDGLEILALVRKGTDHYSAPTVGFRFNQTVSDSYSAIGGAGNSISRIFTSATLISSVGPPTLYVSMINAATAALPTPATGYAKGWLKKQSSITQRGVNRSDITQEWILENWSTFLYGAAL